MNPPLLSRPISFDWRLRRLAAALRVLGVVVGISRAFLANAAAAPVPNPTLELVLFYDELAGPNATGDSADLVVASAGGSPTRATWNIPAAIRDRLAALPPADRQGALRRLGALEPVGVRLASATGDAEVRLRVRFLPWMSSDVYRDVLARIAESSWHVLGQIPSTWAASLSGVLVPLPFDRAERRRVESSLNDVALLPYREGDGRYRALGAWIEIRIGVARKDLLLAFVASRHSRTLDDASEPGADPRAAAEGEVDRLLALAANEDGGEAFHGFLRELGEWQSLTATERTRFALGAPTRGGLAGGFDVIHTTEETLGVAFFERLAVERLAPLRRTEIDGSDGESSGALDGVEPESLDRAFFADPPRVAIIATAPNRLNTILAGGASPESFRTFAWRRAFAGGSGFGVMAGKAARGRSLRVATDLVRFLALGDGSPNAAQVTLAQAFGYAPAAKPTPEAYLEPRHLTGALASELTLVAVTGGDSVRSTSPTPDPDRLARHWRALAAPVVEALSRPDSFTLGTPSAPAAERKHAEALTAAFERLAATRDRLLAGVAQPRWYRLDPELRAELDGALAEPSAPKPPEAAEPSPPSRESPVAWIALVAVVATLAGYFVQQVRSGRDQGRRDERPLHEQREQAPTTTADTIASRSTSNVRNSLLEELVESLGPLQVFSTSRAFASRQVVAAVIDLMDRRGDLLDDVESFWTSPNTPRSALEDLLRRIAEIRESESSEVWIDERVADAAVDVSQRLLAEIHRLQAEANRHRSRKEPEWPESER